MRTIRTLIVAIPALALLAVPGVAWNAPPPTRGGVPMLFQGSDRCLACHNGLTDAGGADISIGVDWRSSMMANSGRDPYWQGAVRREVTDHPTARAAIEDECTKCHMPMARLLSREMGAEGVLFDHLAGVADPQLTALASDGVSCTLCHQILPDNLGEESSLVGGFEIVTDTQWDKRLVYGPFEVDAGRERIMHSASLMAPIGGDHIQNPDLCATCHTLITHSLGPGGEVIGELPEQVPYQEWEHSAYHDVTTCQQCHMPGLTEPAAVSSVWPEQRDEVSPHVFRGGNFFMPRMLNANRAAQGVIAQPEELSATAARTADHVREETAELAIVATAQPDGALAVDVTIHNLAGHKFPTAYPSRRAWLHVWIEDAAGEVVFESGALRADGSIEGNANDEDAAKYEPHYTAITSADQVQIYEPILAGPDGAVTTGLLTATEYAKDNRLLPAGFDKATAHEWVEVHGAALDDEDFTAHGDTVRYAISVPADGGPYEVFVELWYQPIGYRWAHNLGAVEAPETQRFVAYYEALSDVSAMLVTGATATVAIPPPPEPPEGEEEGQGAE